MPVACQLKDAGVASIDAPQVKHLVLTKPDIPDHPDKLDQLCCTPVGIIMQPDSKMSRLRIRLNSVYLNSQISAGLVMTGGPSGHTGSDHRHSSLNPTRA